MLREDVSVDVFLLISCDYSQLNILGSDGCTILMSIWLI